MRFKILLLISPLLFISSVLFAKPVFDSVGVENHDGKKVILHKVEPKETYFAVGRRYNIKPNLIIQYNNNIILQPGAIIKVPTEIPFASTAVKPTVTVAKPEVRQSSQQYKVSPGETLYAISKRFGTTVDAIKADNNLSSDSLSPGQLLVIKISDGPVTKSAEKPVAKEPIAETKPVPLPVVQQPKPQVQQPPVTQAQTTPPAAAPLTYDQVSAAKKAPTTPVNKTNTQQYKVSPGETLYTIAKRFDTSVDDIKALNNLNDNNITPGELLTVRSGMPPAPVVAKPQEIVTKRDTTMVAGSDSLNADRHIPANKYGLFLKEEKGPATWMDDPSLESSKKFVLHRTAPIGTVVKITNPTTNKTTLAKVVGRFADNEANKDVILVVTKNVAESIGATDKRFRVIISYGVPANEQ